MGVFYGLFKTVYNFLSFCGLGFVSYNTLFMVLLVQISAKLIFVIARKVKVDITKSHQKTQAITTTVPVVKSCQE